MRTPSTVLALPALLVASIAGPARGQEGGPARGFSFWVYSGGFSLQELATSSAGVPQFAVGVQRGGHRLGVGLGVVRLSTTDKNVFGPQSSSEQTLSATMFQVGPEAVFDIWRSADSRTRGNLGFGASVGRISLRDRTVDQDPTLGVTVTETRSSGTLAGFHFALGADHYLNPHFALGAEAGLRGAFGLGVKERGNPNNEQRAGAAGTYAALRATVVF